MEIVKSEMKIGKRKSMTGILDVEMENGLKKMIGITKKNLMKIGINQMVTIMKKKNSMVNRTGINNFLFQTKMKLKIGIKLTTIKMKRVIGITVRMKVIIIKMKTMIGMRLKM